MKNIGLIFDKKTNAVFLLPNEIEKMCLTGLRVNVQTGYGSCLNISDQQYEKVGAKIFDTKIKVISQSDIICKINPFTKNDCHFLTNKIAVTLSNFVNNIGMLYYMLKNNVTGLYWNALLTNQKYVLFSKLEQLKAQNAFLIINKILTDWTKNKKKINPPRSNDYFLLLNASFASIEICKLALEKGFNVIVLDNDINYSKQLEFNNLIKHLSNNTSRFIYDTATFENLEKYFPMSSIFLNTCSNPINKTKSRITSNMVKSMKQTAIALDIANDYGDGFVFVKKKPSKQIKLYKCGENFYLNLNNWYFINSANQSEIISTTSYLPLIEMAKNGINQQFSNLIICESKKIVNKIIKTTFNLY